MVHFNDIDVESFTGYVLEDAKQDSKMESYIAAVTKILSSVESYTTIDDLYRDLTNEALVRVDIDTPYWDKVASKTLLHRIYQHLTIAREGVTGGLGDMVGLGVQKGLYGKFLLDKYTAEDFDKLEDLIDPQKDKELTYVGLMMLYERYLIHDHSDDVFETPQERFLIIAMTIMQDEDPEKRLEHVAEAYWALSNLYATVATPTLSNAGKPNGQLSSCFIDTVADSLDGIYLDNWDNARVSKNGGGIGVYMGKVRGRNSSIQNFKNKASGTIPWIRNLNNTAVSVDQLGVRAGAIAIYQDIWHWDVLEFLQIGTNNGDERFKARDVWPGLCIPDYFMELIEADEEGRMLDPNATWYLFDPHEVRQTMGWGLEDSYDEHSGFGTWREKYKECIAHPLLRRKEVPVKEIVKAIVISQLETGAPYMFYRDEVNRMNANKHKGMVYCSNLCSEITQNMSASELVGEKVIEEDGEEYILYKRKVGDFVVCNLASINLGRAAIDGVLPRLVPILIRMLDNVISVNNLPLGQATSTNNKYRPVGLGTFGWHHFLAKSGVQWNSDQSVEMADELYEQIAYLAIEASANLAAEKGSYPVFEGSDFNTGEYFELRGYNNENSKLDWDSLKEKASKGMRNGYWGAVAPNGSTALIAGSTQGIDPFYGSQGMYFEEKKNFKLPILAPDINPDTFQYYWKMNAHHVDKITTILQNAKRQRHIDQAISFNLYVDSGIKAKDLMQLHRIAWRNKLKTTYYVRGTANEAAEDCDACQ